MNREKLGEKSIETLFLLCALVGVVSVTAIIVFVFYKGLHPFFGPDAYSFLDFITGTRWAPGENIYGIFYMIVASVLATVGAIVIGVPVGLLTAVFISELAPDRSSGSSNRRGAAGRDRRCCMVPLAWASSYH